MKIVIRYLKLVLLPLALSIWGGNALAEVTCSKPVKESGMWVLRCSDKTTLTNITHYACIIKIAIETTDPADHAKLIRRASVLPNAKDMVVWSATQFHKNDIISAKLDDLACYHQD